MVKNRPKPESAAPATARRLICVRCMRVLSIFDTTCRDERCRTVEDVRGLILPDDIEIRSPIGVGGMGGAVWKAWDKRRQRFVAVKLLPPGIDRETVKRFEHEALVGMQLDHPNLLKIYTHGELPDGGRYAVMEYIDGRPLNKVQAKEGPLDVVRTLTIVDQLLQGLMGAHTEGIVHRDVKASNIFLLAPQEGDDAERLKLIDYGIADRYRQDPERGQPDAIDPRRLCGTLTYMAPELLTGGRLTPAADLYAVSALAYLLLAGHAVYEADGHDQLFKKIIAGRPIPLQEAVPDRGIPPALSDWVMQGLARKPSDRHGSAREMRQALHRLGIDFPTPSISSRLGREETSTSNMMPGGRVLPSPPLSQRGLRRDYREDNVRAIKVALLLTVAGAAIIGGLLVLLY